MSVPSTLCVRERESESKCVPEARAKSSPHRAAAPQAVVRDIVQLGGIIGDRSSA